MKANELRVFNFVYGKNNEFKIIHGINNVRGVAFVQFENEFDKLMDFDIEPIPLTEEWLLQFGFKTDELDREVFSISLIEDGQYLELYGNTDKEGSFVGYITNDFINNSDRSNPISLYEINHVHKLQNLYFALTGEELPSQ